MSFFVCLTDDAVTLFVQFLLFGFHFGFQGSNFLFVLLDFAAFVFNSHTAALQRTEDIFERLILFADLFFGFINDIIRKSEFGRNSECITFSRNTDQQAVSRTESFHVKFTAGIFHAWSGEGVYFQLTVMGGCHSANSLLVEMGEDRNGKGSTLCRVCTCTKLIKKNE